VQVRGECRLFFLGLLAGSCDETDEVVGIPDRKVHRPPGFAVAHARAHRRRHWITATVRPYLSTVVCPPLIPFLDNAEGDIGKQRRNHTTLRRAMACRKDDAVRQAFKNCPSSRVTLISPMRARTRCISL
jgi:hypothetical protein